MNLHVPYFDYGLTVYPQDRKRYGVYLELTEDHRMALGKVGQKLERKCHKLSKAGAFELTMALAEYMDKKRGAK